MEFLALDAVGTVIGEVALAQHHHGCGRLSGVRIDQHAIVAGIHHKQIRPSHGGRNRVGKCRELRAAVAERGLGVAGVWLGAGEVRKAGSLPERRDGHRWRSGGRDISGSNSPIRAAVRIEDQHPVIARVQHRGAVVDRHQAVGTKQGAGGSGGRRRVHDTRQTAGRHAVGKRWRENQEAAGVSVRDKKVSRGIESQSCGLIQSVSIRKTCRPVGQGEGRLADDHRRGWIRGAGSERRRRILQHAPVTGIRHE